jgi:hypothetical protein
MTTCLTGRNAAALVCSCVLIDVSCENDAT